MTKTRNFLQGFPQIYMKMYISTVLAVAFPPFSLTEVIWICIFVQTRTLTLVCLAVRCRYYKRMLLKGGMGNGEWGMGIGELWSAVIPKKLCLSLRSTAKRRGLHVVSERSKVRIFMCQFFPSFWNY